MNHTCDRSVHFSCGHKTESQTQNSRRPLFFLTFACCERVFRLSLSLSLFFWTLVCCVFETTSSSSSSSSQEARAAAPPPSLFRRSRRERSNIVYLVFAQRRRGQAAASSSLCRSEQRRGCDLTAASFCPLPRGIIVIDSHHQVRLVRFLRLRGFLSAKERKKKEEPPKEPAVGFGETIDFVRFSESLLGERCVYQSKLRRKRERL